MMTKSMLEELRDAAKSLGINTNQPLSVVMYQIHFDLTHDIQYNVYGEPECVEYVELEESTLISVEVKLELTTLVLFGTDAPQESWGDMDDLPF